MIGSSCAVSIWERPCTTVISPLDTIDVFNLVYPVIDVDKQILSQRPNIKGVGADSWVGGRYDWATVTSGFDDPAVFRTDTLRDSQFSPRVDLGYQPWNWLSIYSHYVESFGSNNGRSETGKPFEPQTATQAGLVRLPLSWVIGFGSLMIVGHNLFDSVRPEDLGSFAPW